MDSPSWRMRSTTPETHGSLLLFEGAAGIGKSRLLAEVGRVAQGLGACTLRARGGELEVGFPFGVARQLFEPRLAEPDPCAGPSCWPPPAPPRPS